MLILKALLNFILPKRCAVCEQDLYLFEKHICTECLANMPFTYFWITKDNPAEEAFWGRLRVERVYSLFFYINDYKKLLYKIKYKGNVGLGKWLGEQLAKKIINEIKLQNIDLIVPVPLHPIRKLKRGYNQAEIIAEGIAKELGLKVDNNIIRRRRYTRTQTKKDKIDRWHGVSEAFVVKNGLSGIKFLKKTKSPQHILLVDDVFTTGATLEACALAVLSKYDCKISVATLSYVE